MLQQKTTEICNTISRMSLMYFAKNDEIFHQAHSQPVRIHDEMFRYTLLCL